MRGIVILVGLMFVSTVGLSAQQGPLAAALLGQGADATTTCVAIQRGLREINPLYGPHPSCARVGGTKALVVAATWLVLHRTASRRGAAVIGYIIGGVTLLAAAWNVHAILNHGEPGR